MGTFPLDRVLRALLALACVAVLALHVELWAWRAPYPYDLEWMEGGMLAHAWRLQQGLPLYVAPNADFVPYVYPPGYSAIVAALGSIFGLSPMLGRLVSIAGILLAGSGVGFQVVRATRSWLAALFACTAVISTYHDAGSFYDLVRPDALFLGLFAWCLALSTERGTATAASAGLLLAAAFTTKHNAAAWGPALVAVIAWRDGWRRAAVFGAAAAIPAGLLAARWEWASGGMFSTYLLEVPSSHPSLADRWWPVLPRELGSALPVPLALVVAWAWRRGASASNLPWVAYLPAVVGMGVAWAGTYQVPPANSGLYNPAAGVAFFAIGALPIAVAAWAWWGTDRAQLVGPVVLGLTTLAVSGAMRAHNGGYVNVVAPLFLVIVLGAGLVLGRLATQGRTLLVVGLAAAHLAWVASTFERLSLRPTPADRAAGDRFVAACRTVEGPVLSPFAAWLPTYAGKPPSLHYMAVWDLDYPGGPLVDELSVVRQAVEDHYWDLAIGGNQQFGMGLAAAYSHERILLDAKNRALMPRSGFLARPNRVMRP